jgi:hypothetical protein
MGPGAGLDRWRKSRPSPGFDPRAVQPVAVAIRLRYSDPEEVNRYKRRIIVRFAETLQNLGLFLNLNFYNSGR